MKNQIVYPILEKTKKGRLIKIKAGLNWTDENRIKQYEGFDILFLLNLKIRRKLFLQY